MPQLAYYDHTAAQPAPVKGWYDTGALDYPNLPNAADLLTLTPAQWQARLANPSGWAVQNGELIAYTPPAPAPTFAQQAAAAVGAGLSVALSGAVTLAATLFPTDPITTAKIGAVVTTLLATGAFPGGAASYPMKDSTGAWHTFAAAQYTAVAGAIAAHVAALDLIADGNPLDATALPAAQVSLTV